jgi:hypothetical protein
VHLVALLAVLLAGACGGGRHPTLEVQVVPAGVGDPLAQVSRVRAVALSQGGQTLSTVTFGIGERSAGFPEILPEGKLRVTVDGLSASDELVARGGTRFLELAGADTIAHVFVGRVGAFYQTADTARKPTQLPKGLVGLAATVLPDGRVLLTGGATLDASGGIDSVSDVAYLFDPDRGSFEELLGRMALRRAYHSASLLRPSGGKQMLLLAGGLTAINQQLQSAATGELFDPESQKFSAAGVMTEPRYGHSATLLPDGRVLVAGGGDLHVVPLASSHPRPTELLVERVHQSADAFDPASGRFSPIGTRPEQQLHDRRMFHVAARADAAGRVLLVGGENGLQALDTTEFFTPGADRFDVSVKLGARRTRASVARLENDDLLLAGGRSDPQDLATALSVIEILSLAQSGGTRRQAERPLTTARSQAVAVALTRSRVLVMGGLDSAGRSLDRAELVTAEGAPLLPDPAASARCDLAAVLLPSSETVFIIGGAEGEIRALRGVTTGEIYTPPLD